MNQSCALFEIAFSYQARSQSAQYMFKPVPDRLPTLLILRAAIQKAAAVFPIRQPAQKLSEEFRWQNILWRGEGKIISPVRQAAESFTSRLDMTKILTDGLKKIQIFIIMSTDTGSSLQVSETSLHLMP